MHHGKNLRDTTGFLMTTAAAPMATATGSGTGGKGKIGNGSGPTKIADQRSALIGVDI
jgi:hypothetical protein